MSGPNSKSYKEAGVDIEAGDQLVDWLQNSSEKSHPLLVQGIGGYASLTRLPLHKYKKPILVSCTDGVGTKALLGAQTGRVRGLGQDLVAMNVNDLVCTGGDPYFFLDYWATGKLDLHLVQEFLTGVREACHKSGCVLIGGETAEMPGLYKGKDFDCAGFATGLVDEDEIWGAHRVKVGTSIWAFASSGFHSNGYSLLRSVFEKDLEKWIDILLEPTALYVQLAQKVRAAGVKVQAAAHITGSGFENLLRVLPACTQATLFSYELPDIFKEVQKRTGMSRDELFRTLNCGVGFTFFVEPQYEKALQKIGQELNIQNWKLGQVEASVKEEPIYVWADSLSSNEGAR